MDEIARTNVIANNHTVITERDVKVCVSFNSKYSYFGKKPIINIFIIPLFNSMANWFKKEKKRNIGSSMNDPSAMNTYSSALL